MYSIPFNRYRPKTLHYFAWCSW